MKNSKITNLFLFVLFLCAFFILFGSNSKVNATTIMKVVNTNCLNARKANNTDSAILGTFQEGDLVEVEKYSPTWARLSKNTLVRNRDNNTTFKKVSTYKYCNMKYLTPYEPPKYVAFKTLKVYSEKSSSSKLLKKIPANTEVRVISASKAWAQLSTGGYCLKTSLATPMYVFHSSEYLRIRKEPNVNSEILGKLYEGSIAYVVSNNGKWAKLTSGGYCSMDYLITEREKLEKDIETDRIRQGYNSNSDISNRYYSYFTTTSLRLRKGPSTNYEIIKTLDKFTPIIAIPYKDGWYKTIDGGYLDGHYIAREIIGLDAHLANFSPDNGMIVLKCSNGANIAFHCCGGRNEYGINANGIKYDYRTPTGNFTISEKIKVNSSATYVSTSGPNMNRTLFFQKEPGGYAIHCGDPNILSHGCIHVEDSIQEKIYDFVNVGCPVSITQNILANWQ